MEKMSKPSSSKLVLLSYLHHRYQSSKPSSPISRILYRNPNLSPWIPSFYKIHFRFSSISKISQNPEANLSNKFRSSPKKLFTSPSISRISQNPSPQANLNRSFMSSQKTHFTFSSISKILHNPCQKLTPQASLSKGFFGFRFISTGGSNLGGKLDMDLVKNKIKEPGVAVKNAFSRYRQAVGLQIEAFWRRNSMLLLGAGGLFVCILLWRIMFGIANTFVGLSEGMAKYGFLALSSAIVAFAGLYLRSRFTINPDKVYRMAMRKLNTSADILEIMGAPLTGTDLRAYVMSGGGITLKNFKAAMRSKRCFLIFPIRGSEMKGLVSVEVKNKQGQYDIKLLSVDIPMASGSDQRLFLIGDDEEYRVGGGLIAELRDPVVKAMAATKEFEARDIKEDKEDAERERAEAERKHREEVEKIQREGS